MDRVLGLVLLAVYIVGVVGLAAGITWAVVKLFPTKSNAGKPPENGKKPAKTDDSVPGGKLFRRAKRGAA